MTVESIESLIRLCLKRKEKMRIYLELKYEEEDWHGCQDAASDLRDIDSEIHAYRNALKELKDE